MDLSNLEQTARAAETACMAVIDRPNDPQVREKLLDALAAVIDPAFEGDDDTASARLDGLLRQAHVWADIVRTRIDGFQATKRSDASARSIRYPTRDLLQILSELVGELAGR